MKKYILALSLILMSLFFYSCASMPSMALNEKSKEPDISKNPLALMTVKTINKYRPEQQLNAQYIFFDSKKTKRRYWFVLNPPYKKMQKEYYEYLISFQLPPGEYELNRINGDTGDSSAKGIFIIPLHLNFNLSSNKIVYLGQIEATCRKRKNDNELRSAPVNILSPITSAIQSKRGLYETTFDVSSNDNYDNDIATFKEKFPFLSNQNIEKMILPKWNRPSKRKGY